MDEPVRRYTILKLTQEEIKNLNGLITVKNSTMKQFIIKKRNLLQKKSQAQITSLVNSTKCLENNNTNT